MTNQTVSAEVKVTQKTVDWLTMTESGILIGLAQGELSRFLAPTHWLLVTLGRALLVLSMLIGSNSWLFSRDQGDTWVESESWLGLPKDVKRGIWRGLAQWLER